MKMTEGDLIKYKLWRARTCDPWGFKITTIDKKTYITAIFNDTPAEKAGVGLNEVMVTVNRVPCDNVSHDYISHVISQVDHNMVLVTRRPTNAEAHYVSEIAKDIPVEVNGYCDFIPHAPTYTPSYEGNVKSKRNSRSARNKRDSPRKNEEKKMESGSSDSIRKDRAPSVVVASESYLSKRRHLVEDIQLDISDEMENTKLNYRKETRKINSKSPPSNGTKRETTYAAYKDSKSHNTKAKTLDSRQVNGVGSKMKAKRTQSDGREDGNFNHRGGKGEENHEPRAVESNKDDRIVKFAKRREASQSTSKEPITESANGVKAEKTEKSEPRREKAALAKHKSVAITPSKKATHHLVRSKSTAELDSEGMNKMNHLNDDDVATVKESKQSFPSMAEIRSNLQVGKRRTLLLSSGDSFEDRVAKLNDF